MANSLGIRTRAWGPAPQAWTLARGGVLLVLVLVGVTGLFRWSVHPFLREALPLTVFVIPVIICAALGGFRLGMLATLVSTCVGTYFFMNPVAQIVASLTPPNIGRIVAFAIVGVIVSAMSGHMHHQIERLTKAEHDVAAREATLRLVHDELERRTAELERRTAELESFILHAPIGFGLLDRDKRYVRVNEALAQMNGISAKEHVGRSFADVIPKHLVPEVDRVLQHCLDTGETLQDMNCTSELPTQPVTQRNLLVTIFPVRDSNGIVAIGCITLDITERKRADESERVARAEAERLNRLKDEFVATISHELRTPLTAILGWAQVLKRPTRENDKIDRGLDVIERNAQHLTQIVSDLLDISRIANGKLGLETLPVDLGAVARRTLETVRPIADAKSVKLDTHIAQLNEPLLGDAARIQQIVWNLLSNAIKFTPRGGTIEVRVETRNELAAIIVRDTGQGIAPDFLPHIFERFRQEDSSFSRKYGGLGLGLAIVKHLSELHGGRVIAESDGIGRGATFTVELPLDSRPPLHTKF